MSTRGSIFYHEDQTTGVNIHVYEEALDRTIHLEVEHAHGLTNVIWPHEEFVSEILRTLAPAMSRTVLSLAEAGNPDVTDKGRSLSEMRASFASLKEDSEKHLVD
jgi:hypothetical protein